MFLLCVWGRMPAPSTGQLGRGHNLSPQLSQVGNLTSPLYLAPLSDQLASGPVPPSIPR